MTDKYRTAAEFGAGATVDQSTRGKAWLAGRALTVGARVLADKVRPARARRTDDVPGSVKDITEEWLTAWLCPGTPGARVTSFSMPGGSVGTSTRSALRVTYNAEGDRAGLPTELFVKMASSYRQRVLLGSADAVLAPRILGQADRLWEGTRRSLELATHSIPRTLLHGDSHVGQSYTTADGRMGWTDWQLAMQEGWAYDFAYFVSSACEPDSRREWR